MDATTLHEAAELLEKREVSAAEIAMHYLKRCVERDGDIHAFLKLDPERILAAAAQSDARRASGAALSPLDGLPVGMKDCISSMGETCSCGSKLLEGLVAPYDATVVAKIRAQGMIPFGRLNMDEFAMGSSCENSAFFPTRNPHDTSRVSGGSSGGSAAAVGGGLVPAALGSDTGGSIRQPASFCGIVGMKPTYGRVSRFGVGALASSLDQVGPMTRDVLDAALLLDVIGGRDVKDSTSRPDPCSGFFQATKAVKADLRGVKVGLPKEYFPSEGMDAGVAKVLQAALERVRALGAEIVEVSLPHTKYVVPTYCIVATAEASANLARFDGIRYGKRVEGTDLIDTYFKSRGAGFGDEVKRRILLGTYVLSSGYYDAYYLRAQKVRTLIRRDFEEAAKRCDVLFTPVSPTVAFRVGEKTDPLQLYMIDIFTTALNLAGGCGISVPAGLDEATKMPVGVQFMAPPMAEAELLRVARAFELAR